MNRSVERPSVQEPDVMRGAWIVETLIVALVLLLVGNMLGITITIYAFIGASLLAAAIMLCVNMLRRRYTK
jgi:tellurite resistance protein TehA-like permease